MTDEKDKKKSNIKVDSSKFKNKQDALKAAMDKIHKEYGKEAISLFGDKTLSDIPSFGTGSLGLDMALGIGGYPCGRIIEIYGPEASGKTTLTLHAIAEIQRAGGVAAFIDAEHALDPKYASALGVDMASLLISQPSSGDEALSIAEALASTGAVDIIVIDSVAALVPQAELDADMGSNQPGLQARLMSQGLRKLTAVAHKSNTTILFINQIRMKIGVMFGSPETTSGGNALKFYASVRLDIRRIGTLKQGEDAVGNRSRVKVVKNKVAPPFKEIEFDIQFGKGINYVGEVVDYGAEMGLVEKAGAWYSYKGERIGQGRDNAIEWLSKNPDLCAELAAEVREKSGVNDHASLVRNESV